MENANHDRLDLENEEENIGYPIKEKNTDSSERSNLEKVKNSTTVENDLTAIDTSTNVVEGHNESAITGDEAREGNFGSRSYASPTDNK